MSVFTLFASVVFSPLFCRVCVCVCACVSFPQHPRADPNNNRTAPLVSPVQGLAPMSVKDVLQSLVDDNMVDCERVGTSNYYWAFPSKALNTRKRRLDELDKQHCEAKTRRETLQQAGERARIGRQETEERAALLKQLQELREQHAQLKAELDKYRECDPEVIEELKKSNVTAKEAVSRWTDNVFAIKSWAKRKFSFDDSRIDKAFGIPEDFDYMD
ncbi:meiotic nuclear division protein 1 homolog isoform X2 [Osmerus mordax]|uniref:meiotic nuclear division protein 1 homolog isoform X2 n=1 Tax=Osmerus mordax TaxID=8014 RepID=UPI003510CD35